MKTIAHIPLASPKNKSAKTLARELCKAMSRVKLSDEQGEAVWFAIEDGSLFIWRGFEPGYRQSMRKAKRELLKAVRSKNEQAKLLKSFREKSGSARRAIRKHDGWIH